VTTLDRDDALKRDAMMDRLLDKTVPERATDLAELARSRPELHALVVAQVHLAADAGSEARIELARAVDLLNRSPLPGDAGMVRAARRALTN
jgi:hypothetical protein